MQKSVKVLNVLIQLNNDRIDGYATASKATEEEHLKTLFSQFSYTSRKSIVELTNEVTLLGGMPLSGIGIAGKLFRAWMDLKVTLSNGSRNSLLSSCEYGENYASDTYTKELTINSKHFTAKQRAMLAAQHTLLKIDQNKVHGLRLLLLAHTNKHFEQLIR